MAQAVDWQAATAETLEHAARLIRCDTSNPPGDEIGAIQVIQDILERAGLPAGCVTIAAADARRPNLVARLCGDGSRRPLLLSGHVDVVPAEREHWTHDPFGGEVAGDYLWGRGALDMKGFLAMYLQVFLQAQRAGLPLKRDLILAAVVDEENACEQGSAFLVDRHRELIDAEYAVTETGGMTSYFLGARVYPIQVAAKGVCWLRMTARGTPGHASTPHDDNAVLHLTRALGRLERARHMPVHLTPTFRAMIAALGRELPFPKGALVQLLRVPALAALALRLLPIDERFLLRALLTNTVTPSVLRAGTQTNVIPSHAVAELDCRPLPGQTPDDVTREVLAVTGPGVNLEPIALTPPLEFSCDTPLFAAVERALRRMDPRGVVVPYFDTGASDAAEYQRAGIVVYGFTPGIVPPDYPLLALYHAHDERLPIQAITTGLPALWEVVCEMCT